MAAISERGWRASFTACVILAGMFAVAMVPAILPPPASPASVASAQEPAPNPQPQPTPAPDPLPPFAVKLEGPTKATGGFAVTVTKPAAAVCRWNNSLPAGSMPLELTDNAGRTVLCFFSPAPGVHRFSLAAQLPVDGLDPFAEASLVVEVGGVVVVPPGPVVVDPPVDPVGPVEPDGTPIAVSQPGLRVLIIEETDAPSRAALNAGQRAIILGTAANSFRTFASKTAKAELVCADKDADFSRLPAVWVELVKRPRKSVPWLTITNGKTGYEGPLPGDPTEAIAILKRVGGIK